MASKMFLDLHGGGKMPVIGIGTWQAKNKELDQAIDAALEVGYRHIDTAFAYENEIIIGSVLSKWFESGKLKREDVFVTTKLPIFGVHPDRVEMFMKKSLENLKLDYVDLYIIHFPVGCRYYPNRLKPINEKGEIDLEPVTDLPSVWKKMEEQVDAGRAKAIGVSNFNIDQIERIMKGARIKPANHQFECHVFLQQPELVDYCRSKGITVVAYSPLASPGYNNFLTAYGRQIKELPNLFENSVIKKIADKHGKSNAQVCLRYTIQRGLAAIPKSTNLTRLKENINIFDFELDINDMKSLEELNMGSEGRVCDFKCFPGLKEHPDFPFK